MNNFPISVSQIAEGMNNASSSLAAAGNSFEESVALLTAGNVTIQDASKASTALRTISARIRNTTTDLEELGESDFTTAKYDELVAAVTKYNVSLVDANNEYRSTFDIMNDIAGMWNELNSMEQAALATAVAGTRQQSVFYSMMQNWDVARESMDQMEKNVGATANAYDVYLQSVTAHVESFKATLSGTGIDILTPITGAINAIIDLGGVVVNVTGSVASLFTPALEVAGDALGWIVGLIEDTSNAFSNLNPNVKTAVSLIAGLAATAAAMFVPGSHTVAAILLFASTFKNAVDTLRNADMAVSSSDLEESANNTQNEINDLNETLDGTKKRIEELKDLEENGGLNLIEQEELRNLESENDELERQIRLKEEALEAEKQAVRYAKMREAGTFRRNSDSGNKEERDRWNEYSIDNVFKADTGDKAVRFNIDSASAYSREIDRQKEKLEGLENQRIQLLKEESVSAESLEEIDTQIENVRNNIARYSDIVATAKENINNLYGELIDSRDAFIESGEDVPEYIENLIKYVEEYIGNAEFWFAKLDELPEDTTKSLKKLSSQGTVTEKDISDLCDEHKELAEWMKKSGISADELAKYLTKESNALAKSNEETTHRIAEITSLDDELKSAKESYEEYEKALEGGEKSDLMDKYGSAWQKFREDIDAGKTGSNAVMAVADLFFSEEQLRAWGYDLNRVIEELNSEFYETLFKPNEDEEDEALAAATKFFTLLEKNADKLKGIVDIRALGDGTKALSYTSIEEIAGALGLAEKFVYTAISAMDEYGAQVMMSTSETGELAEHYEFLAEKIGNTKDSVLQFATELAEAGRNHYEIQDIIQQLGRSGVINLEAVSDGLGNIISNAEIATMDTEKLKRELEKLGSGGTVDLLARPVVSGELLAEQGWEGVADGIATVFTNTFSLADFMPDDFDISKNIAINLTPIYKDENGKVIALSPEALTAYAENLLKGGEDFYNLQIGAEFHGEDAIAEAVAVAERIHLLQQEYYEDSEVVTQLEVDTSPGEAAMQNFFDKWNNSRLATKELIVNVSANDPDNLLQLSSKGGTVAEQKSSGGVLGWLKGMFASGTKNAPRGKALVNELGPELISDNGEAYIANGGKPAIVDLNKGAIVLNADETKDALKGNSRAGKIKAFAGGTGILAKAKDVVTGVVDAAKNLYIDLVDNIRSASSNTAQVATQTAEAAKSTAKSTAQTASLVNKTADVYSQLAQEKNGVPGAGIQNVSGTLSNQTQRTVDNVAAQFNRNAFNPGGGSGSGGGGGGSSSDKEESWFEKMYKYHQHLLAMDQEEVGDYLVWLDSAYKQAFNEGIIELDDYYKYAEEVYSKLHEHFKDYLNDREFNIEMLQNQEAATSQILGIYEQLMIDVRRQINDAYAGGLDDTDDYVQELWRKWWDYYDSVEDAREEAESGAKDALDDLVQYRIKMIEKEIDAEVDSYKDRLDKLKEFIDRQKQLLRDQADEEDYLKEQKDKRKKVTDLEAQLSELEFDNSAWAEKRKLELQEQLAEAREDLATFERDHSIEMTENELDAIYELSKQSTDNQTKLLEDQMEDASVIYNRALDDVKNNSQALYDEMVAYELKFGSGVADSIQEMWEEAYKALQNYRDLYGEFYRDVELKNVTGYTKPVVDTSLPTGAASGYTSPLSNVTITGNTATVSTPAAASAPSLTSGSYVDVKPGTKWYADSGGGGSWGYAHGGTIRYTNPNGSHPYNIDGLGWVRREDIVGYLHGTDNATAGLHSFDEDGSEYIFTSSSGDRYRLFNSGDKVLNSKAAQFLYDFANMGSGTRGITGGMNGMFGGFGNTGAPAQINMGDIIINGNADERTVSEIRRAQRDSVDFMLKEFQRLRV